MSVEAARARGPESQSPLWLAASRGERLEPPQDGEAVKDALTSRPRQKRKRTTRDKDNTEYIGFLRRAIRAAGRRVKAEDPSTLAELVALAAELDTVVGDAARYLHDEEHYSWGEIAYELGVTRQAAFARWARFGDSEEN